MPLSIVGGSVLAALVDRLVPVLAVVVGALLHWGFTVRAKRDAARVEKAKDIELRIWDLQRVGYSLVLRHLEQLSETAHGIDEGYQASPTEKEEPHTYGFSATSGKIWPECQAEFARNQLIFSREFVRAFRRLESHLEHAQLQMYPSQVAAGEASAFGTAYADLMRIALKDLGLNKDDPSTEAASGERGGWRRRFGRR